MLVLEVLVLALALVVAPVLVLLLEPAIWTAKTPPNGPLLLLLETLTRHRLLTPLIVPVQDVPAGISTANG